MLKFIRDWMLLFAMLVGGIFYKVTGYISFLTPYLIFVMLLLTFSKLSPRDLRFNRLHWWLLTIQAVVSIGLYFLIAPYSPVIAGGVLICVLAPTATSAAVITGMLGGNVAFLTTYTLISSVAVAFIAPLLFSFIGVHGEIPFGMSFLVIARQLGPLLILPLVLAWGIRYALPSVHRFMLKINSWSFYLWTFALMIVTGMTVKFLVEHESPNPWTEIIMAGAALVICSGQFILGRYLGRKYNGDAVSAGQGLGQKNTILAIWMAQTYLNPLSSIAPAAYVLWQNLINSYQLWRKARINRRG